MRIIALALLALVALSAVNAQSASDIQKMTECMDEVQKQPPCQKTDTDCQKAEDEADKCSANCTSSAKSFGDIASCLKSKCSSQNKDVQAYIDKQAKCLNSSIISFVLAALVASFAFLF
ncbi:hypothetical protein ABPG74_019844 [Tetrahymena malaccensis]